jgi:methyltransferase-like protein/cyclopropane fatty-acyl-phospholipid synthase-like methyltransferase
LARKRETARANVVAAATSYDEVPYESLPYPQSHPNRLATIASLFGMQPAPVTRCRVLELGCAAGGNLIPMAASLPDSEFVGIDGSTRQIADGQEMVNALKLQNVQLRCADLAEVAESGPFDYVVAHGVYSWIPDPLQDKLLEICERALAPNGVAYVSYNTYPGWHYRGMIRDMMLYHTEQFAEPSMRATQARALLDYLVQSLQGTDDPYPSMLRQNLEQIRRQTDSYLLHDHLEEVNDPIYFYQFVERAGRHGLQYLGEAEFATMLANTFPKEVAETLQRVAKDIIRMEQYMDFLRNRSFRQTLLCRANLTLKRNINPQDMTPFRVSSPVDVPATLDIRSTQPDQFRVASGTTLTTSVPIVKAAFQHLAEIWPRSVSFDRLLAVSRSRLSSVTIRDQGMVAAEVQALGSAILTGYTVRLLELQLHEAPFVTEISDRPQASDLAREQAKRGGRVTNQRHEVVNLDEFSRRTLALLDGTRNRDALLEDMSRLVTDGTLVVEQEGQQVAGGDPLKAILGDAVDRCLSRFAKAALCVA